MRKRMFQLDDAASQTLLAAYHATDDGGYRTRLQAVRLYGLGYSTTEIQIMTGSPRSTIMDWVQTYQRDGIAALADQRVGGNHRFLTPDQVAALGVTLRQYTPHSRFGPDAATPDGTTWTLADLHRLVTEDYGVTYHSTTSYSTLFARVGFTYHRPTATFRTRNERAVMEWEGQIEKNFETSPPTQRPSRSSRKMRPHCICKRRPWRSGLPVGSQSRCGLIRIAPVRPFMAPSISRRARKSSPKPIG